MCNDRQTRYNSNALDPIPPEDIPAAADVLGEINEGGTPPEGNLDLLAQVDEILKRKDMDGVKRTLELVNLYFQKLSEALNPVPPVAAAALIVALEAFAQAARNREPLAGVVADAFNSISGTKDFSVTIRRGDL